MNVEQRAWERVSGFLSQKDFCGFTKNDLFIKRFVPKGWGQDIAALSSMAEAILQRSSNSRIDEHEARRLRERRSRGVVMVASVEIGEGGGVV